MKIRTNKPSIKKRKIKDKTKIRVKATKKFVTNKELLEEFKSVELILPKDKRRKILAIVLKENQGTIWRWIPKRLYRFSIDEHTYFVTKGSQYTSENNIAIAIYFEGISIAMCHRFIQTEEKEKTITLLDGKEKKFKYSTIKGVKIDSMVIDFLLNRGLADEFTKKTLGIGNFIQILLTIGVMIMTIIICVKVFI